MHKGLQRTVGFVLLLLLLCPGCKPTGVAAGYMSARYNSRQEAIAAYQRGPIRIETPSAVLDLHPAVIFDEPAKGRWVGYHLSLELPHSESFTTENEIRRFILPRLQPRPVNLYAIDMSGVKHSPLQTSKTENVEELWDVLWEHPPGTFSYAEVMLMIPPRAVYDQETVGRRRILWIPWPSDERTLKVEFEHNSAQDLLTAFTGLVYRNANNPLYTEPPTVAE